MTKSENLDEKTVRSYVRFYGFLIGRMGDQVKTIQTGNIHSRTMANSNLLYLARKMVEQINRESDIKFEIREEELTTEGM